MNILDEIVAQKRIELASLAPRPCALGNLLWSVQAFGDRRNFVDALKHPANGSIGVIAEVKKASPSAGVIRVDFDPVAIARGYESAGASCISVLTDEKYFQGSLTFLQAIRDAVKLPLLRKDFIIHERQILESIEAGADAILLIVAILDDSQLRSYRELAEGAGLGVLVEVHDDGELDRALLSGATLIGVNNRNLKTFKVDLATTERLAPRITAQKGCLLVAESGIQTGEQVARLKRCGAQAILVGESLMRGMGMRELVG